MTSTGQTTANGFIRWRLRALTRSRRLQPRPSWLRLIPCSFFQFQRLRFQAGGFGKLDALLKFRLVIADMLVSSSPAAGMGAKRRRAVEIPILGLFRRLQSGLLRIVSTEIRNPRACTDGINELYYQLVDCTNTLVWHTQDFDVGPST